MGRSRVEVDPRTFIRVPETCRTFRLHRENMAQCSESPFGMSGNKVFFTQQSCFRRLLTFL